jgi:ornithine cyclodeaminase/alanine dehydrogenase-like protein (mu-crystallin family)
MATRLNIEIIPTQDPGAALGKSDVCVTCTPSKKFFLCREAVRPGTFIAAVGADSADKQELEPALLAAAKVVVDILEQCATIGELHHALAAGVVTEDQVHGELGEIVAGQKAGRTSKDEIVVFDSTGTALQDVAAAAVVYEKALATNRGLRVDFAA